MPKDTPLSTSISFKNQSLVPILFGECHTHLNYLEKKLKVTIADRGNTVIINGDSENIKKTEKILKSLWEKLENGSETVEKADIDAEIRFLEAQKSPKKQKSTQKMKKIALKTKKKTISPRSPNQAHYLEAMLSHEMVFGLGPAGTGKTYLAVAAAVNAYLEGRVERLIFCRPAVEAGERLGFLPGDMKDKVDPYLRPIYDALHDMLHWDVMVKKMEMGDIEIAPLAFMRGRTLSNAFVILDEAQNSTCTQMKMFLTRMGEASHMVITGDITQTDLPIGVKSGLREATEILGNVDDIAMINFERDDVIRHPLVGKIIDAYDTHKS